MMRLLCVKLPSFSQRKIGLHPGVNKKHQKDMGRNKQKDKQDYQLDFRIDSLILP